MSFTPTPHPVLTVPTVARAMEMGAERLHEFLVAREQLIAHEKADPYTAMWEPPIWKVCDALLDFPWVDPVWAEAMRRHLGFERPVDILLINGGNRGGKTEYSCSRGSRIMRLKPGANVWAIHKDMDMSRKYHQSLYFKYLPPALKAKDVKGRETYVSYKRKTGFSDEKFVVEFHPGASADCTFKTYEQGEVSIEGGNLDFIGADEHVPAPWIRTLEFRIAERSGRLLVTFTPTAGYTEAVAMFQDGAEIVKECVDFLNPKDGGAPDVARAMGLLPEELAELNAAALAKDKRGRTSGRASWAPQSRPQNCDEWLTGGTGQPEVPAGREFERVPRVMKVADGEGKRAVVFFHSSDNPYGNPKNIWGTLAGKSREFIKERWYGLAHKLASRRFPIYNEAVHVINDADVPKEGVNILVVDPSSGRNFFMAWFRITKDASYLYREWPGNYLIPGVGIPGAWAVPDGKRPDGRPGPAQSPFGFGQLQYKEELARLERWKDYTPVVSETVNRFEQITEWDERHGAEEVIERRLIDSRFASAPRVERDRPVTLITEFQDIGVDFEVTPGDDVDEGVQQVTNLLHYDVNRPVSAFNRPKLFIARSCQNTRYALRTWTGYRTTDNGALVKDANGACRDPVDCLRYFALSGVEFAEPESWASEGGGHYR